MKFVGAHIFSYDATFRGNVTIEGDLTTFGSPLEISSSTATDLLKLTTTGSGANPIKLVFEKTSVEQGVIEYNRNGDLEIYNTDVDGGVMISGSASADPDFYISHAGASTFKSTLTVGADDTGYDVRFYGATSGRYLQWDESQDRLEYKDNVKAIFGSDNDLHIYHDGSNSIIKQENSKTGNLIIQQETDDADLILKCDDGSGGLTEYITLDGSSTKVKFNVDTKWTDNDQAMFGNGEDLRIYHDGSDSKIAQVGTGDLYIQNSTDDKDIIFQCDDGSGGVAEYIRLDGSATTINISKNMLFPDAVEAKFGDSTDLKIKHAFNNSEIENNTGNLNITNYADDKDVVLRSDDGSGGVATYFFLDGSRAGSDYYYTTFPDKSVLEFGTGNDMQIWHDGSHSQIKNVTGNLTIRVDTDDGDIKIECDDGSGGVAEYLRFDGSATNIKVKKDMRFSDGIDAEFGDGGDFKIYHDGSNTYLDQINSGVGNIVIQNQNDDADIIFKSDDGSGGITEYFSLDGSIARTKFSKDLLITDNVFAYFGTSNDFSIVHGGVNSNITNNTGNLNIIQNTDDGDIIFKCDDGSGGTATYLTLDGGSERIIVSKDMRLDDSVGLQLGAIADLSLAHDGTNSEIANNTGDLRIKNRADDKDIIFETDDGSGGIAAYLTLDGSAGHTIANKEINFPDGVNATFGNATNGDLRIHHTSGESVIHNTVGHFYIGNLADDKDLILQCDNGSGGTAAYMTLDGSDTDIKVHKNFEIEKTLTMQHTADPSDPATGHSVMWSDTSGNLKVKINVGGSVVTRTLATGTD